MLAGLTARQLVKEACLRRGDAVVVNAAGGGIGHLVVQLVRQAVGPTGRIVGVCGPSKRDTVLDLGADEVSPTPPD
jgi:NADPH2:quinone reductase